MRVIRTIAELVGERASWGGSGPVGLVPTMGYLHEGHLSLVRRARAENAVVAVSIFVNPTQFGPREDLSRYPRDLPRDLALLESAEADVVFTPAAEDMYPPDFATYVDPVGPLTLRLEAASRPGHFRGVATVVAKLFNLVRPDRAYFGQKDAQQVAVIRRMVRDLAYAIEIRVVETVREPDGLALSSRNVLLDPARRGEAAELCRALNLGRKAFRHGERSPSRVETLVVGHLNRAVRLGTIDYVRVADPETMLPRADDIHE